MLQPVILCGGDGTRLWPASRKALPKQFMPLHGTTLFKESIYRAAALPEAAFPLVICNNEHRFMAAAQLQEALAQLPASYAESRERASIVLEPMGRNTAPAIALAALHLLEQDPVMLVMPADHQIPEPHLLARAVEQALPMARAGHLITFGVVPTSPETGYGYIRKGAAVDDALFHIDVFIEKPDLNTAEQCLSDGNHYWNSGMFLFRPRVYLDELRQYAPAMAEACQQAYAQSTVDLDFIRADTASFAHCPADSIDYAVMEHTQKACVVPLPAQWSDLGSWESLYDTAPQDSQGNAIEGDVLLQDSHNNLIVAQSRLVTGLGLQDMVVVETADAVMVAPKVRSQDIKQIVTALKLHKREEAEMHLRVYRPWGSYESLIRGDMFQVKRLIVQPGHQLSLQMHYHRAEHWVVVQGTASVTLGETELLLKEDESTYIPVGTLHRLANKGKLPLEIIEIQTGSYLGEDDIVRTEDVYGR